MTKMKLLFGNTAPRQTRKSLYVQQGRVYCSNGISPVLTTLSEKNAHIIEENSYENGEGRELLHRQQLSQGNEHHSEISTPTSYGRGGG